MNKKLVASIFLYEKEAITSFDDLTVISKDPVTLAKMYSDKHADELLIFDLSMGDKEHEEALDVIKDICENVEIPVIGAGNVKRMEDVKKLLYAGCQKAVLNYSCLTADQTVWTPSDLSASGSRPYFLFFLYSKNLRATCSKSA